MEELTLSNGLRIVHKHSDSAVGYCGFMVDCGSRNETSPELFGIAHFIEHILFKGTKTRDSWHINNRMESVGGELNAFTTKEETTFFAAFLNEDFSRACELLCDLVCNPTAPQHELEKEQEVVIEEIDCYRDTPSELIFDEFENRLFAGHPLGHNILGSSDTVHNFDSRRCLDFIDKHYTPDRMVFFSYGKTPFNKVINNIERFFNNNRANSGAVINTTPDLSTSMSTGVDNSQTIVNNLHNPEVIVQDTHQAHVVIGTRTYKIGSPKSAALAIINNILGGPGMNSRLNRELREKRGLVYTVEGNVSNYTDAGYQCFYFGCDPHDMRRCIDLCHTQMRKMYDTKMSAKQLQAAQKQLKGQFGVASANMENMAIALAKNTLRLGKPVPLEETCARIDSVSCEQIQEVAYEVFAPEKLCCVVIR